MTTKLKSGALVALYLVCAFLVYGWDYNRPAPICGTLTRAPGCSDAPVADAVFNGIFWPITVSGRAAVLVTRP
jgi:hypothetical protein